MRLSYAKCLAAVFAMCCSPSTLSLFLPPPPPPGRLIFVVTARPPYCLETMSGEKKATFRAIDDELQKEDSGGEPVNTFFFVISQVKAIRK